MFKQLKAKPLPIPAAIIDDSVITLDECARSAGISRDTLDRMIARGQGPIVTAMSERRRGVRIRHHREWLDQLARVK